MKNTKQIMQQIIDHPVELHYNNALKTTQKIAGIILLLFFLLLGISIFMSGLETKENGVYYIIFGTVLCLFPVFVYFIIQQEKSKHIIIIDKNGVTTKHNLSYNWESLLNVTYHSSLYEQNESNRFVSVQFTFNNGKAIATYKADKFSYVLFIANNLPVPKNEKSFTYFK